MRPLAPTAPEILCLGLRIRQCDDQVPWAEAAGQGLTMAGSSRSLGQHLAWVSILTL